MSFFPKTFPFSCPKFLMTFFIVIDQDLLIFRIFTVLNVLYDPFFTRKTTNSKKMTLFYSIRTFVRIRQHYFSKYLGERMHVPSPHLKFFGGPSPLGLCPWIDVIKLHYTTQGFNV